MAWVSRGVDLRASAWKEGAVNDIYCVGFVGNRLNDNASVGLLKHWLDHYLAIGVKRENFRMIIAGGWQREVESAVQDFPHERVSASSEFDVMETWQIRQDALGKLPRNAWVMTPDMDEFFAFPMNVNRLAEYLGPREYDCHRGFLLDCVHNNGLLTTVDAKHPLDCQFSIRTRLTRKIGAGDGKVVLWRNYLKSKWGHHDVEGDHKSPISEVPVLHYKWTSGLRDRVLNLQATAAEKKYPWDHAEYQRTLDLMEEVNGVWSLKMDEVMKP